MKNAPLTALAAARCWLIALLILFTSQIQSEEINSVRFDIGKSVLPRIVTDPGHDPCAMRWCNVMCGSAMQNNVM